MSMIIYCHSEDDGVVTTLPDSDGRGRSGMLDSPSNMGLHDPFEEDDPEVFI